MPLRNQRIYAGKPFQVIIVEAVRRDLLVDPKGRQTRPLLLAVLPSGVCRAGGIVRVGFGSAICLQMALGRKRPPSTRSGPDGGPFARVHAWDRARPARFRLASSDKLAAGGLGIEPLALFFTSRGLGIALCEQLVQGIAGPLLRLHDEALLLIAMPTVAPGCKCRMSSRAGGTASMTEPPTQSPLPTDMLSDTEVKLAMSGNGRGHSAYTRPRNRLSHGPLAGYSERGSCRRGVTAGDP